MLGNVSLGSLLPAFRCYLLNTCNSVLNTTQFTTSNINTNDGLQRCHQHLTCCTLWKSCNFEKFGKVYIFNSFLANLQLPFEFLLNHLIETISEVKIKCLH